MSRAQCYFFDSILQSLTSIPPGLDYTIYIGMTAITVNDGPLEYSWETGEPITYTHWDENEPGNLVKKVKNYNKVKRMKIVFIEKN